MYIPRRTSDCTHRSGILAPAALSARRDRLGALPCMRSLVKTVSLGRRTFSLNTTLTQPVLRSLWERVAERSKVGSYLDSARIASLINRPWLTTAICTGALASASCASCTNRKSSSSHIVCARFSTSCKLSPCGNES
ncbi:unnamed protein product [Mycena citricolor]|uniref:Uncharacterized protein n=1 Tax=Mycena citricolor TaxID=2018698 RepID=A0AAD2H8P9_9AGAR|nr:unnamed protein product [Mycena citricolor]